ncbi:MAG: serine hydrolase [Marinoscillum sp.]
MTRYLTILSIFLFSGCYVGEELPPDQNVWEYGLPREFSMSETDLFSIDTRLSNRENGQINSLIIIKDDHLVFENYYNGYKRPTIQKIDRATNAVTTLVLGLLIEDGLIPNIDVAIKDYLPDYQDIFEGDDQKSQITIRHILNHKSGLPWDEYITHPENVNSDFQEMRAKSDWCRHILGLPMEAPPGLRIVLNSGASIILSSIFQNALGETKLETYIDEKLFQPMDITNYEWEYDPSGNLNLGRGLSLNTIDFTKLGYLMLLEGRWSDRSRIINRDWVLDSQELHILLNEQFGFGYGWWAFTDQFEQQRFRGYDTYFLSGSLGQNLYVVPELNFIVAIAGENFFNSTIYNPSLDIFIRCLATITSTTGSEI